MIIRWLPNRLECSTDPKTGKSKFWFLWFLKTDFWSTPCIQARFWVGSWSRILNPTAGIGPEDIFLQDIGWRSCLWSIKQFYRHLNYACSHVLFQWNHGFSYKIRVCVSDPTTQFSHVGSRFSQGSRSRMLIPTSPIDADRSVLHYLGRRTLLET